MSLTRRSEQKKTQLRLVDLDAHVRQCAGIPRSAFEQDVKAAMRVYRDEMDALLSANRTLQLANETQSQLVAEMQRTVREQTAVIVRCAKTLRHCRPQMPNPHIHFTFTGESEGDR